MQVLVSKDGDVLWSRNSCGRTPSSFTGNACQSNEVKQQVIAALTEALRQAQGQLGCFEIVDAVANIRSSATKIDRNVPMTVMRHDNLSGEHPEKTSVSFMLLPRSETLKIGVVRKPHVALVAALDDDDVASV